MYRAALIASIAIIGLSGSALAQSWGEYVSIDARFGINFPGAPTRTNETYVTTRGVSFPAEVFTASDPGGRYSVTAVDFSGVSDALRLSILDDSVEVVRNRGGEVTYDGFATYDGMDSMMIQITNGDNTRSFLTITQTPQASAIEKLFIVEGRVGLNQPVPGHFSESLIIVDLEGDRLRYNIDIEGTKFRVIPGTGGEPLLTPQCALGLPCVPGRY